MDRPDSLVVQMAAVAPLSVVQESRAIAGLAVPYGPVGNSSLGAITFSQGSLTWGEVGRVKLLRQHDPERSVGFATNLTDGPDGLHGTFEVPESAEGDIALAEAADGRRDGLSVGVLLDEEVLAEIVDKWIAGDNSPTAATGRLLEVSQVSIPAFDDARTEGSAAAALSGHVTLAVQFAAPPTQKENIMADTTVNAATPAQAEVEAPAPSPNPALTASAQVAGEAPIYTFDGTGPSFVRDMWRARFEMDTEAHRRVEQFNSRYLAGDANQMRLLTAAVETRTTSPNFIPQPYKPELLVETIDKGRPLVSRIGTFNLTDATPFRIPVEGDMVGGVGAHTEGTAHVAEGDLTTGEVTVTPGAISGAFRLSRELIDATNPALDRIALNAMLRQYRYATEASTVAALAAIDSVATVSINTVQKVRVELNNYFDLLFNEADGVAMHPGFYSDLLLDADTTGRPMLASIAPQNAAGTPKPGFTGATIDGVELFKAPAVSANDAYIFNTDDVLIGESSVQTFRFEEVEGPGVVKLALWSYFVAKVTRAGSVVKITSKATD